MVVYIFDEGNAPQLQKPSGLTPFNACCRVLLRVTKASLYTVVCLRALFLLLRLNGADEGGGGIESGDGESFKDSRAVGESCRV